MIYYDFLFRITKRGVDPHEISFKGSERAMNGVNRYLGRHNSPDRLFTPPAFHRGSFIGELTVEQVYTDTSGKVTVVLKDRTEREDE